jgi:iron complex transport system substrate-binding protein
MELERITGHIVDCSIKLHTRLGPGLLESVYESILARDLTRRGLVVERQKQISFDYEGLHFEEGLRVDLLINSKVVVELKSTEKIASVHWKQVLTYLRLLDLRVGLLVNFGAPTLRAGLHRIVNDYSVSGYSPRLRER